MSAAREAIDPRTLPEWGACECGGPGVYPYGIGGGWAVGCISCAREADRIAKAGTDPDTDYMTREMLHADARAAFGDDWRPVLAARIRTVRLWERAALATLDAGAEDSSAAERAEAARLRGLLIARGVAA